METRRPVARHGAGGYPANCRPRRRSGAEAARRGARDNLQGMRREAQRARERLVQRQAPAAMAQHAGHLRLPRAQRRARGRHRYGPRAQSDRAHLAEQNRNRKLGAAGASNASYHPPRPGDCATARTRNVARPSRRDPARPIQDRRHRASPSAALQGRCRRSWRGRGPRKASPRALSSSPF